MADGEVMEEDSDVFQIDDFTSASEWERFISSIEEILGPNCWMIDHGSKKKKLHSYASIDNDEACTTAKSKQIDENHNWEHKEKVLKIENFDFVLHYDKLNQPEKVSSESDADNFSQALYDSMDFNYNFPPRTPFLSRWFGVKEFLTVRPKEKSISTLSQINLIWSSIGIALSNTQCTLPFFFQIKENKRLLFYGMCLGGGIRSSYEMIQLNYTPHNCNHVQGMIETFKAKIASPVTSPIFTSIRFCYIVKDWAETFLCEDPFSEFDLKPELSSLTNMPFGPLQDPIRDLQVAACWPCLSSDVFVDDANYSELNPLHAPQWSVKVCHVEDAPTLLYSHLYDFFNLCNETSISTEQVIRRLSSGYSNNQETLSGNLTQVLDRLAEPVPNLASPLSKVVSSATRKLIKTKLNHAPIPEEVLNDIFEYLFPDARKTEMEAGNIQQNLGEEQKNLECEAIRSKDKYRHLKSAPVDSLIHSLAICTCIINSNYEGLEGVAHLWHEFVLELRYRFENNIFISRLAQTHPNLNYCLLHQKLQMLNYCISKRRKKHVEIPKQSVETTNTLPAAISYKDFVQNEPPARDRSWNELLANISRDVQGGTEERSMSYSSVMSSDDEEEFFEAREEFSNESMSCTLDDVQDDDRLPEGVQEETDMKLLRTGKSLCIPITQEPPPLTEDMLLEQQNILTELGTSAEAARLRAQMQSASLLSDMESFKAANPGCTLEDFVRWYSPNDWLPGPESQEEKEELHRILAEKMKQKHDVPTEGWEFELDDDPNINVIEDSAWSKDGHLSLRMRVPGNMWREVWVTARPVPARLQKRLFDDTKEGEKVLHFLSNLSPSEIALHMFPSVIHSALIRIHQEEDSCAMSGMIEKIIRDTSCLVYPSMEHVPIIESIIQNLHTIEENISRLKSLRLKFMEDKMIEDDDEKEIFIKKLLKSTEVILKDGPNGRFGKLLKKLLEYQKAEDDATKLPPLKINQDQIRSKKINRHLEFPEATGREYILRTNVSRPSPSSRSTPQRLFTVITPGEFRMAGSFCEDTNFI